MSKAASAAAREAAAAAAAAAAREAAEEQAKQSPREIDFSTFSDEALHAYVTHYKLAAHFPPRSLLTSTLQSSAVPAPPSTPSDGEDDADDGEEVDEDQQDDGSEADNDDDGNGDGDDDHDEAEGGPPRKRRRRLRGKDDRDRNSSLISTAHIIPADPGSSTRKRAAAVAAAAAVTASSLTGAAAASAGPSASEGPGAAGSSASGVDALYGLAGDTEEPLDPEDAAALENLADVHAARAYLSRAVSRHFASLPAPKEGEVVVGFLYRAKIRDKVLKIADYNPPPHLA